GSRKHPQEITLNGAPFRISRSLGIALRCLRQANDSRRLWVDAIRISQEQNDEKLHQVAQMRSTYKSASRVLVWLGPSSENSASGFDLMEAIATHLFPVDDSGNTVHRDIELSLDALTGILELLQRLYWYRMWIVQEIAVASKDPVVGCG
ncbi:heterokaryon incompatibility, partial [Bisporella sp. PMI_857]